MIDDDSDMPLFTFKIGSYSHLILSHSHKKICSRCNKLHLERKSQEIPFISLMEEDIPSPLVSLIPFEKQFHVLTDIDGEEDTCQITSYSPPPVVQEPPLDQHHSLTTKFRYILRRSFYKSGHLEIGILQI